MPQRGRTGPPMAQCAVLRVSSTLLDISDFGQGERTEPDSDIDSTQVAQISMAGRDSSSSVCTAITHRPPVSSRWGNTPSAPRQGGCLGLARERANLNTLGLPHRVVATMQNARAASTHSLYGCKWRVFSHRHFEFLQDLINGGKSFSTIKVYLVAIAACHVGFDGTTVGQHPLIHRFMKGACRSLPATRRAVPGWDLSLVLEALSQQPFEPLGAIPLKQSCLSGLGFSQTSFTCEVLELSAFHPPPFSSEEDQRLNALCPVRALRVYIDRTSLFRRSDQLFIFWALPNTGNPISKQRLSHWLVEAISLAYESKGVRPPRALKHIQLEEWQPPGPYLKGFPCRTFVPLQAGPLLIHLSDTGYLMLPRPR
ncbi:Beta-galactosidase [Labeo rohita]|uniref:Beta-galactosidase n=1 Tax=Labeo rohita TaxID=84645 RepID=A0ABQ8MMH9_LABRO|nr:Beta-galactosidase [Labeo rohita]